LTPDIPGLIIIFFGIGAIIVAAACVFSTAVSDSVNIQLIIFMITSIILLLSLRRWVKKIFVGFSSEKNGMEDHLSEMIGKKAKVVTAILPNQTGKVELNGTDWKARADVEIPEDSIVEVVSRENITLIVKAI